MRCGILRSILKLLRPLFVINQLTKLTILFSFFFIACQSSKPINLGIQKGFEAVNPAAVIAVPIFTIPDPSFEFSSIDPSILPTQKIIPSLEDKIIESFNHQPNINGYPFAVIKKAIGMKPPVCDKLKPTLCTPPKSTVWNDLNSAMQSVAARFSSRDIKTRVLITPNCLARKNFIEFYSYCLAQDKDWLAGLNTLSSRVLNADSALITVITHLENKEENQNYKTIGSFAILLVDTNNGKLIWGNFKKEILINPPDKKYFPQWDDLLNKVLDADFWNGFPGRIAKNELIIKSAGEAN